MPLDEEGAKWSCEPCIRGHRSSKCQHFDRLMMKVPKAGRPLAKCPHPKGTCSCQKTYAFMVRIPKGSTCLCRPLYKVPASPTDSDQPTPTPMLPVASPALGKIQKPGRRQSHIHAAPENIMKALEAMPENVKQEDGSSTFMGGLPAHQPTPNGNHSPRRNSSYAPPAAPAHAQESNGKSGNTKSCCSSKPPPIPAAPSGGGSCCGGKSSTSAVPSHMETLQPRTKQPTTWNDMSYMNASLPQNSWQNSMPSTQASYMPSFGIHEHQSSPYFQNMDSYSANASSAQYPNLMNGLGISQAPIASFSSVAHNGYAHTTTPVGDPCHDCKCGDECQCLGCAAHPFNNTTRQHVQEMGVMMTFDDDEHSPDGMARSYQPHSYPSTTAPTPLNFFMQQTPSMDNAMHHNSFDPYSNPNSAMPSGYSSPLPAGHQLNQQLMHPSEYYTLEYPVGIPSACSDVTGSCQCGNDCSCVGCLTHSGHNGVPLEAPLPEQSVHNGTDHQVYHENHHTSTGAHSSRIPTFENMPVSCCSPRKFETSMI
ncbi:hypothetical protein N7493_005744 [Penicillium malachiteum]|uniref:Copper-fist domain-containing protein n=1 Tax=Penicillium malachiteum TaxID=1324776 RepID=A0AAD6HNZ0_9EURO|nr:hypothetical protein N7493_005744 [Penicillium malachiteum]